MSLQNHEFSAGTITSLAELELFVSELVDSGEPFGFDIETGYAGEDQKRGSLRPEVGFIAGFSFSGSGTWARYVPLRHEDSADNLDPAAVAPILAKLLYSGQAVIHNALFEVSFLVPYFLEYLPDDPQVQETGGVIPFLADTMLMAKLIAKYERVSLKELSKVIFNSDQASLESLIPKLAKNKMDFFRFNYLSLTPDVVSYACDDAVWCLLLYKYFNKQLPSNDFILSLSDRLVPVLHSMTSTGLVFDWDAWQIALTDVESFSALQINEVQRMILERTGDPTAAMVNLNSPAQVGTLFYDTLGLPEKKDRKTGNRTTNAKAIQTLAAQDPIVAAIIEYKEVRKLISSYLKAYVRDLRYDPAGRVHPGYNQTGTITGRLSSSNPNIQQCFTGEVEVLTRQGWQRMEDVGRRLQDGDSLEVVQFLPGTGVAAAGRTVHLLDSTEFVEGTFRKFDYSGPLVCLEGRSDLRPNAFGKRGRGGTWRFTPEHRIGFRARSSQGDRFLGPWLECSAKEWGEAVSASAVGQAKERKIPRGAPILGGRLLSSEQRKVLSLAVMCQADGYLSHGRYYVGLTRPRKVQRAQMLLVEEGKSSVKTGRLPYASQNPIEWDFSVAASEVSEWLDAETKTFIPSAILSLSYDELLLFLDEVMFWDGDFTRKTTYGQHPARALAVDVVQAAGALCGRSTSLYNRPVHNPGVVVSLSNHQYVGPCKQDVSYVDYSGSVYCMTVASGFFLVRSGDGVVQVTGNSPNKKMYSCSGTDIVVDLRKYIVAPPGQRVVGFDFAQQEYRVLAGLTQEPSMLATFEDGIDVHKMAASKVFGIPTEEVTDEQRSFGKTFNFAMVYQQGSDATAEQLGVSIPEAEEFMSQYFSGFTELSPWMQKSIATARDVGYVTTYFGRKVPLFEYTSDNAYIYAKGDRLAINAQCQGTGADITLLAMVRSVDALAKAGLSDKVQMCMSVHDAVYFYADEDLDPVELARLLKPAVEISIPNFPRFVSEWCYGDNFSKEGLTVIDDAMLSSVVG